MKGLLGIAKSFPLDTSDCLVERETGLEAAIEAVIGSLEVELKARPEATSKATLEARS